MGEIRDDESDWQIVFRFAEMLKEQHPHFNITQAYALFAPTLCWTMQRMRKLDGRGRRLQLRLRQQSSGANPWALPIGQNANGQTGLHVLRGGEVPDLSDWPVEPFLIALRNAVAHSDNRCVVGEHELRHGRRVLVGYRFKVDVMLRDHPPAMPRFGRSHDHLSAIGWKGDIVLKEPDMRRIGIALADQFCHVMTDRDLQQLADANGQLGEERHAA